MPTTQNYLRTAKKALLAIVETTAGTFQAPTLSTDAIPIENFDEKLNPQNTPSSEVRGTLGTGEDTIGGFQPDITGSALLRGSTGPTVAPRLGPVIRACGFSETTATVIPTTGTTTASAGTTTSFTVDRSTGNGADWPATTGAMVGRPIVLSGNPATAEVVLCVSYVVTGSNAVVGIHKTFGVALSTATLAKAYPGIWYKIDSAVPPSLSVETYVDGKRRQYSGVRGNLRMNLPGGEAGKFNLDLFGTYVGEADIATPVADFSTLPAGATWKDGIACLSKLEIAATTLDIDTGNAKTRHPNPNVASGFDVAFITKRNARGTLQTNAVLVATHARIAALAANTKMSFAALLNVNAAVGARWALTMPAFKILDVGLADKEGIVDDSLTYQATESLGDDEFSIFTSF